MYKSMLYISLGIAIAILFDFNEWTDLMVPLFAIGLVCWTDLLTHEIRLRRNLFEQVKTDEHEAPLVERPKHVKWKITQRRCRVHGQVIGFVKCVYANGNVRLHCERCWKEKYIDKHQLSCNQAIDHNKAN